MPHNVGSGSDDLASNDEIKVFKDEGDDEKRASAENLTELKSSLITLAGIPVPSRVMGGPHGGPHAGSPLSLMMPNIEAYQQPPPAHMGSLRHPPVPPVSFDPKTGTIGWMDFDPITGIPRPPMYPFPGHCHGQYSHFPDLTQQFQWHSPAMYPLPSSAFRGAPYPSLTVSPSNFARFAGPPLISSHAPLAGHPALAHPALLAAGNASKHTDITTSGINNHSCSNANNINNTRHLPPYSHPHSHPYSHTIDQKPSLSRISNGSSTETSTSSGGGGVCSPPNSTSSANHSIASPGTPESLNGKLTKQQLKDKAAHVKKPLNAFMLYMKEMRAKVVAECTLKESAAINQILGRRWHGLSREEQAKYYDLARKERQLHMQLYPGWTARDNYAANAKKKKKKRDKNSDGEGGALKKCRARFGLDQQNNWCKPCRRKKKCIRYLDGGDTTAGESEENVGSVGSLEAPTPDSKSANESDHDNLNYSSAELSLNSPPVPNSDYIIPHHNHHLINHIHNGITPRIQITASSPMPPTPQSCPPRNSPFSIEQLARPHCPQVRPSSPSKPINNHHESSSVTTINGSKTPTSEISSLPPLPSLPTPPSSDSSSTSAPPPPAMLSVA